MMNTRIYQPFRCTYCTCWRPGYAMVISLAVKFQILCSKGCIKKQITSWKYKVNFLTSYISSFDSHFRMISSGHTCAHMIFHRVCIIQNCYKYNISLIFFLYLLVVHTTWSTPIWDITKGQSCVLFSLPIQAAKMIHYKIFHWILLLINFPNLFNKLRYCFIAWAPLPMTPTRVRAD